MLQIDPVDYHLAVTRAELQVAQAELALAREEEEAELAKAEWGKVGEGEPSDLVLRKPQLKQAQTNLAAAKAGLEQANINLERTNIRAPFACRVRSKQADVGQVAGMGNPVAIIYAVDYAEVRLPLPDAELAYIDVPHIFRGNVSAKSPEVTIKTIFAGKEYSWDGKLSHLEGEIDALSRMVHAVARVKNPYAKKGSGDAPPLSVGMFVTAEIAGKTYENVYQIKREALRGESTVWVIDSENKLHFREVDVLRVEKDVAIINSGLQESEKVCLTALDAVVEGMDVSIQD
jgi:RND family efflux transporter MFP subunit